MHYAGAIRRRHVESAAIRSVGYDAANWVLQVEYKGGKVYNYFRVPPQEYAELMSAASMGNYVNRDIKPYYDYEEEDGTDD